MTTVSLREWPDNPGNRAVLKTIFDNASDYFRRAHFDESSRETGRPMSFTDSFRIEPIQACHRAAFVAAAQASADLHHPWIAPPRTRSAFAAHLRRYGAPTHASYVGIDAEGALVGCVHLNEIVYGALQSAYLAYFVFRPFQGQGMMQRLLSGVIDRAFSVHDLHRVEANIQPDNVRSQALVQRLGFRLEGFSPRYLKIDGAWRDHERYALTREEWPATHGNRKPSR